LLTPKKFYIFLSAGITLSLLWVFTSKNTEIGTMCYIKWISSYPCPACGTTRSVYHLLDNNWLLALKSNPLGYLAVLSLIVLPLWVLFDLLFKRETLFVTYQWINNQLKNPKIWIPLALLMLANWIWNIYKEL
jgi:hypothetical protein